ncbi:MAG: hypothetical protein KJ970_13320 [Candidatus Eisenbacteria bacterium]|uniref:Uncharacterized protein n=1 Tax=Eiseniibacteriota bacterium TaxID=2212470 RepID=A0A948S130_UNCEI|nr:hypothetical protein [Candidatus Eisenbacteria bacterium]MBU1947896.1 hypothetical protein [Candidatus Eisenbacteria bacterium]MBU2691894.1 hypothetical protein [Candidatus Eisenbacteria bacterium]
MSNPKEMSLVSLAAGAAGELFDYELANVLANIDDPNTKADAVRKITLEISIKPSKDREMAEILISCRPKLPVYQPATATIFMGRKAGKMLAFMRNPAQMDAFDSPTVIEGGKDADSRSH